MSAEFIQFRWWWNNIGNAFIDIGTTYFLGKIVGPDMPIYQHSSSLLNLVSTQIASNKSIRKRIPLQWRTKIPVKIRKIAKKISNNKEKIPVAENHVTILEKLHGKYYVFSGMLLDRFILQIIGHELKAASKNGKLILLGVGGEDYTIDEAVIRKTLNELKPFILVSRDKITFDLFGSIAEYSYNGIDMGFYVSQAFKPLQINEKYVAFCFDKNPEPDIDSIPGENVIRLHHALRPDLDKNVLARYRKEKNVFISDNPYDYLTLYANALETHSDRVHACVASLSYGVPCKLYYISQRAQLFRQLGINPGSKMQVPKEYLEEKLRDQLDFVLDILSKK